MHFSVKTINKHRATNNSARLIILTRTASSLATAPEMLVDVSYVALQAHGIINVALHWEYSPSTVFV
jgi:hypothetical protein